MLGYGAMVFNALGPDNEFRKDAMAKGLSVLEKINKQCLEENIDTKGLAKEIYWSIAGMLVRSLLSAGSTPRRAQLEIYYGALQTTQYSFN